MFRFFKKDTPPVTFPPDLSFLHTDIHSHFIPGIDDGSPDISTSMALIAGLSDMGYKKIITTPHVMEGNFPNTPEVILAGLEKVQQALQESGREIIVQAAAEYFMDEHFERMLAAGNLLPVTANEVLVEVSFMAPPLNLHALLFEMQTKGYQPILAHPERYGFYHHDFEQYHRLKELGCKLQLNINSLSGYYGKGIKMIAHKLLDHGLIDYAGSDMHHYKHLQAMQSLAYAKETLQKMRNYPWKNADL